MEDWRGSPRGSALQPALQATAARRRRELRSRTLFTKPLTPVAGQPVEIYYNPGGLLRPSRCLLWCQGSALCFSRRLAARLRRVFLCLVCLLQSGNAFS